MRYKRQYRQHELGLHFFSCWAGNDRIGFVLDLLFTLVLVTKCYADDLLSCLCVFYNWLGLMSFVQCAFVNLLHILNFKIMVGSQVLLQGTLFTK